MSFRFSGSIQITLEDIAIYSETTIAGLLAPRVRDGEMLASPDLQHI